MRRVARVLGSVLFCSLCAATLVHAETVRVTSGSIVVTGLTELGSVNVSGTDGFSLVARLSPDEGRVDPFTSCGIIPECFPGDLLSVGAFMGTSSFSGTATLNGVTYTEISGLDDPTPAWELTGMATIPGFGDFSPTTLLAPFTISSGLFSLPGGTSVPMAGRGTASVLLIPGLEDPSIPRGWLVDRVEYTFEGSAAPVPEPTTLLLVGSGLAGAIRLRPRRRTGSLSRAT